MLLPVALTYVDGSQPELYPTARFFARWARGQGAREGGSKGGQLFCGEIRQNRPALQGQLWGKGQIKGRSGWEPTGRGEYELLWTFVRLNITKCNENPGRIPLVFVGVRRHPKRVGPTPLWTPPSALPLPAPPPLSLIAGFCEAGPFPWTPNFFPAGNTKLGRFPSLNRHPPLSIPPLPPPPDSRFSFSFSFLDTPVSFAIMDQTRLAALLL